TTRSSIRVNARPRIRQENIAVPSFLRRRHADRPAGSPLMPQIAHPTANSLLAITGLGAIHGLGRQASPPPPVQESCPQQGRIPWTPPLQNHPLPADKSIRPPWPCR